MSDSRVLATLSELPGWKKVLLGLAGTLLSGGLVLKGVSLLAGGAAPPPPQPESPAPASPASRPPEPRGAATAEAALEPGGLGEEGTARAGSGLLLPPGGLAPDAFRPGETPAGRDSGVAGHPPGPRGREGEAVGAPGHGGETAGGEGAMVAEVREEPAGGFLEEWSPAMLKGGVSFFLCFLVGCALRSFARLSAVVAGLLVLALFLLAYAGWIDFRWEAIQSDYEGLTASVVAELSGFKAFLKGSLPSAGMGGLGLIAGWKRR